MTGILAVAVYHLMMAAGGGVLAVAVILFTAVWLKTRMGGTRRKDSGL